MAYYDTAWYINAGDQATTGYYAVVKWAASTAVGAGTLRRQLAVPALNNERIFICIVAGTTGASEPAWTLTRGAKTTDGTVTWMECTGLAGLNGDAVNTATWTQAKIIGTPNLGAIIKRNNGASYQICTTAGSVGAAEPAFSDTAGVTTTETSATTVWTSLGSVGNFPGGGAPHARLQNACGSNWASTSGNVNLFVGDNHNEAQNGGTISIQPADRNSILCHNHLGSYPPTAGDLTTGAIISTTLTGYITVGGGIQAMNYYRGLTFKVGIGNTNGYNMNLNCPFGFMIFENCSFQIVSTNGTPSFAYIGIGSGNANRIFWENCTVFFNNTAQSIMPQTGFFSWRNTGPVLASGSLIPTGLFQTATGVNAGASTQMLLEGLDLSQINTNIFYNNNNAIVSDWLVKDCKLNPFVTMSGSVGGIASTQMIQMSRCDSGAAADRSERYTWAGAETTETSITRVGGAVGPTGVVQSRKIVTNNFANRFLPFKLEPYAVWSDKVGVNVSVTVCGVINGAVLPMNDEVYLEAEYLTLTAAGTLPMAFDPGSSAETTLSNNNLTATRTAQVQIYGGARAANYLSTGKYYFEFTVGVPNSSSWTIAMPTATYQNLGSDGTNCMMITGGGLIYANNAYSNKSISAISAGHVIGIAVDLGAHLGWARRIIGGVPDNWNGDASANPTTGVGGVTLAAGSYAPAVGFGSGSSAAGSNSTLNTGQSSYVVAAPPGFNNWAVVLTPAVLGKIVTTAKSNPLLASTPVPADASTWNNAVSRGPLPAVWDAAISGAMTLSNGNRTALRTSSSTTSVGALTTIYRNTGKYYFEFAYNASHGSSDAVGALLSTGVYGDMGNGSNCACCFINFGSGAIYANGGNPGNLGTSFTAGDVIGCALDLDNKKVWFRKNAGNWNNVAIGSSNPATTTGGFTIANGLFSPAFVAANTGSVAGDGHTLNTGQAAYANAAPAGFGNWLDNGIFWTPFKLTTTLSSPQPALTGYIYVRARVPKPNTTVYIDPQITVS